MTQSQALMLPACRRKSHGGDAQSVTDPAATRVTAPAADDQPPADKSDTATSSVRPQQQRKAVPSNHTIYVFVACLSQCQYAWQHTHSFVCV